MKFWTLFLFFWKCLNIIDHWCSSEVLFLFIYILQKTHSKRKNIHYSTIHSKWPPEAPRLESPRPEGTLLFPVPFVYLVPCRSLESGKPFRKNGQSLSSSASSSSGTDIVNYCFFSAKKWGAGVGGKAPKYITEHRGCCSRKWESVPRVESIILYGAHRGWEGNYILFYFVAIFEDYFEEKND